MDGIVSFSYATWSTRYPELAKFVQPPQAQMFFTEATMYCDNTANSPITDATVGGKRELILYMLLSHIAALNADMGTASSQLVGRIASATQGSVSVSTQNDYPPGSVQWFQTTKYGAAFWAATVQYRLFRYRKGTIRNMDVSNPFNVG